MPEKTQSHHSRWSLEIEGLRGIAVLLPVVYHANLGLFPAGFLGVDIFFVISGYLITGLLWRELFSTGRINFARFYARRARRILPAAILVLVASAIAMFFVFPDSSYLKRLVDDYLAASLQMFNILQVAQSNSYWAEPHIGTPILHYWSLGVEEQFYALLPLILVLTAVFSRKIYQHLRSRQALRRLPWQTFLECAVIVTLAAITLASFLLSATQSATNPDSAYYLLQYRAWQLGAGALTFYLIFKTSTSIIRSTFLTLALGWAGLALILYSALSFNSLTVWPGYHAGIPVLGTMLVIYASAQPAGASRLLRVKPLRALGRWSYSLYLWHLPALILTEVALRRELTSVEASIVVLSCILAAALTYKFVEQPVRHSPRFSSNRNGLLLGLGLIVVGLLTAFALHVKGNMVDTAPAEIPQFETLNEQQESIKDSLSATGPVPSNLNPRLGDINFIRETYEPYSNGCHGYVYDTPELVDDCTLTPSNKSSDPSSTPPDVWMIGDSHAASWYPAFEQLVEEGKISYTSYSRSGCQASRLRYRIYEKDGSLSRCSQWLDNVSVAIAESRPDILFIANYHLALSGQEYTDDLVADFAEYAGRVIVLGDYPTWRNIPDKCLFHNLANRENCNENISSEELALRTRIDDSIPMRRNIVYAPTLEWFCVDSACPLIVNNIAIMSDTNHLTLEAARMMAPRIEELIFEQRK